MELIEGLVNLITPAYNSGSYIFRLLDSVLSQTYPKLKMIIVDDGSTDDTKEVIDRYIPLFANRGYQLVYVFQENAGTTFAINNALKLVDGEFLLWPDSDDWYKESESIEKLVSVLQYYGDEVGVARCRYEFVSDYTFELLNISSYPNYGIPEYLLEDAVYERNGFLYPPGGWIIKAEFLDEFIPGRTIYAEKEAGQNSQILLPYLLNCKCVSIDSVLYCYLVREGSLSRAKGFENQKRKLEAYIRTWLNECDIVAEKVDKSKFEEYYYGRLWMFYSRLLKNDIEYCVTSSFRHHIKECNDLNIPLSKRYRRMGYWTKLFSVSSYLRISEFFHQRN